MSFKIHNECDCTPPITSSSIGLESSFVWKEYQKNPIYNPYPVTDEDYFPCVLYNSSSFLGFGDFVSYKMWHQANTGQIALSLSNDGINWTLKGVTNLPNGASYHACVLFDANAFGGTFHYKIWYWTGNVGLTAAVCHYAESNNGITFVNDQSITQVPPLMVDGISPGLFYHFYGPGCVLYNPNATSITGRPLSFPYAMYYDIAAEDEGPGSSDEAIGLAYSSDGLQWTRYGIVPVLIPIGSGQASPSTTATYGWGDGYAFRASVIIDNNQGTYVMYYTGSNLNLTDGVTYAHGLGNAVSNDGVTWRIDPLNPIFYYNDGQAWRNGRTYAPCVLNVNNEFKMWFSGGAGSTAGILQGIGYATIS